MNIVSITKKKKIEIKTVRTIVSTDTRVGTTKSTGTLTTKTDNSAPNNSVQDISETDHSASR